MNRGQLIDAVAAATELPRTQVEATITATLAQVRGTVASGEKVQLPGFGTFEPRGSAARVPPTTPQPGPSCSDIPPADLQAAYYVHHPDRPTAELAYEPPDTSARSTN